MPEKDNRPIGRTNAVVAGERRLIPWIWEGMVAEGAVTLLSAPEKVGKTTLLSLLLDRRRAGGELLGRTVYPGKTVLCSEENDALWALRQPPLDFGPDLLFHRLAGDRPSRGRWKRFIDDLCVLSFRDDPFDLLVIDTAVRFLPLGDRNKKALAWALAQLSLVADFPAGVLILNQSRNVQRPLAASADIVIEMAIPRGLGPTRRRTFAGVGRYPGTLEAVSAELNAEGTDYRVLPGGSAPVPPLFATLEALLRASPVPLTRQELLARWPEPAPRPDTLWRVLTRGVERGLFTVRGAGTKTDALRYGLAGQGHSPELPA
jgi:AAA domain